MTTSGNRTGSKARGVPTGLDPRLLETLHATAEWLGGVLGWLAAPAVGLGTGARRSRLIHATGDVHAASMSPATDCPPELASSLRGAAMARFSAALGLGRRGDWPDVLGLALRLPVKRDPLELGPGTQDLLLVSARSLVELPFALFRTRSEDYLANDYYGMADFVVPGLGSARLRVRWSGPSPDGEDRSDRLVQAVARRSARGTLEALPAASSIWCALAHVRVGRRLHLDQQRLTFSPFRDGLGITPSGWLQAMRRGPYAVGQRVRLVASGAPAPARPRRPRGTGRGEASARLGEKRERRARGPRKVRGR